MRIGPPADIRAPDNRRGRAIIFGLALITAVAGTGCTVHGPVGDVDGDRGSEPLSRQSAPKPEPQPPIAPPVYDGPDPGAAALVGQIDEALESLRSGPGGLTSIGLSSLTNRSTASAREFTALLDRLETLLDAAGGVKALDFHTDPAEPVDFELRGTVYLINAAGFDHWELFLELRPTGMGWSIWNSPGPIRLLRTPALGAMPQILMPAQADS